MIAALQALEPRRLAGGLAVLVLHLLIIAALLSATRWNEQQSEQTREIILHLIAPKRLPEPAKKIPLPKPITAPKPAFVPPATFSPPPDNTMPQLNGLNRQLFGCAPNQLAAATAQERAACASASLAPHYDPHATDYRDHTDRSKDAVRWARGRARKNGPMLLPCANPQSIIDTFGLGGLLCLAKAARDGKFDPDMQPGYADKPPKGPPTLSPDAGQPFAPID
jgi:hypothetical protein